MTDSEASKRRPGRPKGTEPAKETVSLRLGPVYRQAKTKAEGNGETVTVVVERKLTEYLVEEDTLDTLPPLSEPTRIAVAALVDATVEHEYGHSKTLTATREAAHATLVKDLRSSYVTRTGNGDGLLAYVDITLRILIRDGLATRVCQCRQLHPHGCPHGSASGSIWCARHYEADVPPLNGALLCGTCHVGEYQEG